MPDKAETPLQGITRYIIANHHELGFSPSPKKWVGELIKRSRDLNCYLAEGTFRQILNGTHGDCRDEVLGRLVVILRTKWVPTIDSNGRILNREPKLYVPLKELSIDQLRLRSVDDFKRWENDQQDGKAVQALVHASYNFTAKTNDAELDRFEMLLPATKHPSQLTRNANELHYIAWRHALEQGGRSPKIAREVVSFTRLGNGMHEITMSYTLSDEPERVVRTFQGPVIFLGQSHMCVMFAAEETSTHWDGQLYRGRTLFMRRINPVNNPLVRFGLLATTRVGGDFEPCAACTIMMRTEGTIDDIHEYRRMVTLVRPLEQIMEHDFGGLSDLDQSRIERFMRNVPEGEGDQQDRVLRLHLQRFNEYMPDIRDRIVDPKNKCKNPIISNWKSEGVLLEREDETS